MITVTWWKLQHSLSMRHLWVLACWSTCTDSVERDLTKK